MVRKVTLMAKWQVNQARNHLSEVLDQADSEGPQIITRHGQARSVVLSMDAYRSLEGKEEQKPNFVSFLLSGPKFEDFEVERDRSVGDREIEF